MRIALYGGSFNPIHMGHFLCAERLITRAGFDRVIVIPCKMQPLKGELELSGEDRYALLEKALGELEPKVEVSRVELDRAGPSYSYDTILEYKKGISERDQLVFVMGYDAFAGIAKWRRYPELLSECGFLVVCRKGTHPNIEPIFAAHPEVARIDLDLPEVSATEIRANLMAGKPLNGLVPGAIEADLRALHTALAHGRP